MCSAVRVEKGHMMVVVKRDVPHLATLMGVSEPLYYLLM